MNFQEKNEEIKNSLEEKNLQRLREEFNQKGLKNRHPKTSHQITRSTNHYNDYLQTIKKYPRYNKALSANKYKKSIYTYNNKYQINDEKLLDFNRKYPGYLYYKEILSNYKNNKIYKNRTFTGNILNRHIKIDSKKIKFNKNQNFPKIRNNNYKIDKFTNPFFNQIARDNPYSLFWPNKILNKNDYRIEIRGMEFGVPIIGSKNKKNDNLFKNSNREMNKIYQNQKKKKSPYNFGQERNIQIKKENKSVGIKYKDKEVNIKNENEEKNIKKDDIQNEIKIENIDDKDEVNESFNEEQQQQFYKNQKNFFKARKDIMEEPEYLEEDNEINEKSEVQK